MMKKPFFTIAIPACNVAKYVQKTLESIKRQEFDNFECLIVNETSTDATAAVIRETVGGDPRFIMTELPVSGSASVSRNYGIEHAHGEYLLFVDGDDWLEPDALKKLNDFIAGADFPDLVVAEYRVWRESEAPPTPMNESKPAVDSTVRPGWRMLADLLAAGAYRPATWRNCYRTTFLQQSKLRQIPGRRHQDDEWTPQVYYAAKTAASSGIVYYNYLKRGGSITTKASERSVVDVADNLASGCRFWRSAKFPPPLAKEYAHWQIYAFLRFFSPNWKMFPWSLRLRELRRMLKADGNLKTMLAMSRHARRGDRTVFHAALIALLLPPLAPLAERLHERVYHSTYRPPEDKK